MLPAGPRRSLATSLVLLVLLLLPLTLAAPPCGGPFTVSLDPPYRVLDACRRERTFRGYNMVEKSAPWIPSRTFSPGGGSLSPQDTALWQSLGANVVRLGVMWSGVVPTERGVVNTTLASAYAELSASILAEAGVYALLDAHQDGFSPYFCDDGAPVWAAREYSAGAAGFPSPVGPSQVPDNTTGCFTCDGSVPWAELYFTSAVGRAFASLYGSSTGQNDFGFFWAALIAAFATSSNGGAGVLALELINEPWCGDVLANPALLVPGVADAVNLQPFYNNVTELIRAAEDAAGVPHHIIAMEPITFDNTFPAGFTRGGAFAEGLSMLSHHYYSLPDIVGPTLEIEARAADALRLGASGFLTEFDLGLPDPVVAPYTALDLRATLDACDAAGHSYTGWVYGSLFDGDPSRSTLYVPAAREMARPLPWAVAGSNASWAFTVTATAPSFHLNYSTSAVTSGSETRIFLSTGLWFDASQLTVSVISVPPGAVTWALEHHDGVVSLPAANTTRVPMTPFAWAELVITAAAAPPPTARVFVAVA